jgi:ABC-type molybdate transport system permease subunit
VPTGDAHAMRLSLIAVAVSLIALLLSEILAKRATQAAKGRDAAG